MTTLAPYTQIAELVKLWADKIVSLDPADPTHRIDLGIVAQDMHAFSNGLVHTAETFAPIVAQDNDNLTTSYPFEMTPIIPCNIRRTHGQHNYTSITEFACPGVDYPPMVPEDV